jgi:hypothetical protein
MTEKQIDNLFTKDVTTIGKEKAIRYTHQLKKELRGVKIEEDVRLHTYTFLRDLTREMGVNVKIQNEKVVLTGGRIDSLYDNIAFEFKKPNYFDNRSGIDEAVEGRKNKGGLIEYLISLALTESHDIQDFMKFLSMKNGVGFDGKSFFFVRYVQESNTEISLENYKERLKEKGISIPSWLPDNLDGRIEISGKRDIESGQVSFLIP